MSIFLGRAVPQSDLALEDMITTVQCFKVVFIRLDSFVTSRRAGRGGFLHPLFIASAWRVAARVQKRKERESETDGRMGKKEMELVERPIIRRGQTRSRRYRS